jgi:hypothetical protein
MLFNHYFFYLISDSNIGEKVVYDCIEQEVFRSKIKFYVLTYFIIFFKLLFILYSCIYQTSVLLWMHDPVGRDAIIVKQALSAETKNLQAATEVICSRTPSQIQCFKQIYHSKFGVPLEFDIEGQASGDHKKVTFLSMFLNFAFVIAYYYALETYILVSVFGQHFDSSHFGISFS